MKTQLPENPLNSPYLARTQQVIDRILAAKTIDEIVIGARDRILSLFDAQKIIIYVYDALRHEIFTRFLKGSDIKEQRLPAGSSNIPGFVVSATRKVCIKDVYDVSELAAIHPSLGFDRSWDESTGFRTTGMMAVPVLFEKEVLGALVITNPRGSQGFSRKEEDLLESIGTRIGICFKDKMQFSHPLRFAYLLDNRLISHDDLKKAMELSRERKIPGEIILMDRYRISKKDIGTCLAHYFGCRFYDFEDQVFIPPENVKGINLDYLRRVCWIPVAVEKNVLVVAIDDPLDVKTAEVRGLVNTRNIEFRVALATDILKAIDTLAKGGIQKDGSVYDILEELKIGGEEIGEEDDTAIREDAGVIVRLVHQLIIDGYNAGASDIHIEPDKSRKSTQIRFRIDGQCVPYQTLPLNYNRELVSRIKILANLDISEKRLPQDGKIKFQYTHKALELRIATIPTVMGENMVMRILASSKPLPLSKLGLSQQNLMRLEKIIQFPYGIILVVGPTGSGKTTSLHSVLGHINTPERKIWTAEDPVEITQQGLCQVEVRSKINYTFAAALRSFLRADPDVIMIGEMRDLETAGIAVEASLTGHLVLSTLHTNSAPETVTRLFDMGIDPFNFADAL
ncbi:MAG: GspE/PulE family protein, partial [Proteobacteria bacterium]|nr:GspE/PulE family protein [Pseudomonadota bacterium]